MDIVASIITLFAAIVGLIGSIYAVLMNRTTRKILLPDHALMVRQVLRIPLDKNVWKRRRGAHTFLHKLTDVSGSILGLTFVVYPILSIVLQEGPNFQAIVFEIGSITSSVFVRVTGLIIIITYSFIGLNILLRRQKFGKTPEEGRFFIFKDAIITVEAEYRDIVNRCYEVLKTLNVKSIELDPNTQTLEGQKIFRLYFSVGIVKIEIRPTDQEMSNPNQKSEYSIRVSLVTRHSKSIELTSEITNAFIEQFIGQTKP